MNHKSKVKIGVLIALLLCACTGCFAQQEGKYTAEELNNLAEIKIYSAENHERIKTVSDEEQLYQYNQCSVFDASDIEKRQDKLEKRLEGAEEEYELVSYKHPAALFGDKEPEENTTITLYKDTNIVKMTVAEESVKGIAVSEEFLVFYYEASEEEMNFYWSLVE